MLRFSIFIVIQEQLRRFAIARVVEQGETVKGEEVTGWFTTSGTEQDLIVSTKPKLLNRQNFTKFPNPTSTKPTPKN